MVFVLVKKLLFVYFNTLNELTDANHLVTWYAVARIAVARVRSTSIVTPTVHANVRIHSTLVNILTESINNE